MEHEKVQGERTIEQVDEMTEEVFLKDIYLFMKTRDTPIERIPHLGFKQIDLFVMYKTVQGLGGYHQVTTQQLWKQVYNILGGNPRSTSAATCTRRHYEKLLLPYECHIKGELMSALPQQQPKYFHYDSFSKGDDGQRPAKRKPLPVSLHQNPHNLMSESHMRVIPLPVHYSHYYHPGHPVLPPYVPISSSVLTPHSLPDPQHQFSYHPPSQSPTDKQPLEHLRYLAEQYKSSSGLAEPLNLSFKASSPEINNHPASSFTPPSSSKNPKFLNKPSPLYPPKRVMRDEECETQDNEAGPEGYYPITSYSHSLAREGYVIDLKSTSTTSSSSPTYASAPTLRTDTTGSTPLLSSREGTSTMVHTPSSPKTDFTVWPREEREGSLKLNQRPPNVSHVQPSCSQENGGNMEIQIPLAVLQDWIRLFAPSATMHGAKQLPTPTQEEDTRKKRSWYNSENVPTNLTFHSHPRDQGRNSVTQDLSPPQRNVPSPTSTTLTASDHHHYNFSSYKPMPSSGILKDAASQDVYPWDQQDINKPYSSKLINGWDPYDRDSQAPAIQSKIDSSPLTIKQDFVGSKSSACHEDVPQGKKDISGKGPSAMLMVNSTSAPLLHLTSEEVMKLKRIISSSL